MKPTIAGKKGLPVSRGRQPAKAATAARPALQPYALASGFVSVASFVWLAWSADGVNAALGRVVTIDLFAIACLVVAALSWALTPGRG